MLAPLTSPAFAATLALAVLTAIETVYASRSTPTEPSKALAEPAGKAEERGT